MMLLENGIKSLRLTFKEMAQDYKFDEGNGKLYVQGKEIALVYFRVGYDPKHYQTEEDWKMREIIELSQAIKCPGIDYQLVNFKIF